MTVGPFEPSFESLTTFECPDWFRDAKFGIWSHWGPQSVPRYGDWYARHMYRQDTDQYRYHLRTYGHPSTVGYKDVVRQWKAERFDPDGLMERFVAAGARYFVAQAVHHDNFFNYESGLNHWNSVKVGPGKDIVGLWKAAADERGIPFGITEHLGAAFSWMAVNKGSDKHGPFAGVPYDGADPANRDFYLDNSRYLSDVEVPDPWYCDDPRWHRYWLDAVTEMIDRYQPDLLYSDGPLPFGEVGYTPGLEAVSRLYNTSARLHGTNRAVYQQKDRRPEISAVGVMDIERSQTAAIHPLPWQTDTSVGDWFYNIRDVYKTAGHVIEMLVDIVSKNGNLLLNVPQLPDGTVDLECSQLLDDLGSWTQICGEGIYGTRPFRVFGEGPASVVIDGFTEDRVNWTSSDFRFTRRDNTVYAFQMAWPADGRAVIRSFAGHESVAAVRLLGHGPVPFEQAHGILVVRLPETRPVDVAHCLAVDVHAE
ncbi:alpha-L-fucosidase [Kribbella sp. VKM Ac-2571]|uniref:alpha-L-fucosidase n=1 Tax=Kribbella sp. VKM Ac-2571 TaxID=2512222 RepID=UPI00105C9BC3|nr:alpha-L-fucosidase [Kribbella sp. VKM Ac-2571]TDO56757.1 alpha-L-fucosidase [Kribbella sp. VKM Ac-2571]